MPGHGALRDANLRYSPCILGVNVHPHQKAEGGHCDHASTHSDLPNMHAQDESTSTDDGVDDGRLRRGKSQMDPGENIHNFSNIRCERPLEPCFLPLRHPKPIPSCSAPKALLKRDEIRRQTS